MINWRSVEDHIRVAIVVLIATGVVVRLGLASRLRRRHREFWVAANAERELSSWRKDWLSVLKRSLVDRPGPGADWVVRWAARLLYALAWVVMLLLGAQLAILLR